MKNLLVAAMTVGAAVALGPVEDAEPLWTMPNLAGIDLQAPQTLSNRCREM